MTAEAVVGVLNRLTFKYRDERELQTGITAALEGAGFTVRREVSLTRHDRIDMFLEHERVGIEVKVGGNADSLHRQLVRYAECPWIEEFVVVTNRATHAARLEGTHVNEKPVHVVRTRWL